MDARDCMSMVGAASPWTGGVEAMFSTTRPCVLPRVACRLTLANFILIGSISMDGWSRSHVLHHPSMRAASGGLSSHPCHALASFFGLPGFLLSGEAWAACMQLASLRIRPRSMPSIVRTPRLPRQSKHAGTLIAFSALAKATREV